MLGKSASCHKCQTAFTISAATAPMALVRTACPKCRAACAYPCDQFGKDVQCASCLATFVLRPARLPPSSLEAHSAIEGRTSASRARPAVAAPAAGAEWQPALQNKPQDPGQKSDETHGRIIRQWFLGGALGAVAVAATFILVCILLNQPEDSNDVSRARTATAPANARKSSAELNDPEGKSHQAQPKVSASKKKQEEPGGSGKQKPSDPGPEQSGIQPRPSRARKLSKAEVADRGVAATGLLEIPSTGAYCSAFCVHPAGLFLTGEEMVRGIPAPVLRIVVNAGQKNQRILSAEVARFDRELGLALLRAHGAGADLPFLRLDTTGHISKGTLVTVLGHISPFRQGQATTYPRTWKAETRVSAVQREMGKVQGLQLLPPGEDSFGSPVLDDWGEVAGMVGGDRRVATRFSVVVPAHRLAQFLATPTLELVPMTLTWENIHKPALFGVRVFATSDSDRPLQLELVLGDEGGESRTLPMHLQEGVFRVAAVPVLPPRGPRKLAFTARYDTGVLTGVLDDCEVQVGGRAIRLSEVGQVEFNPPRVTLGVGTEIRGALTGLKKVETRLGGRSITLDLTRSNRLELVPPTPRAEVACTIIAKRAGREVARLSSRLSVRAEKQTVTLEPGEVAVKPPDLPTGRVVRKLPAAAHDVVVGGGGRYLIFHLAKLRRLAVFDVSAAKVTGFIPLSEDSIAYTAGQSKLVVALPGKRVLERWSLTTFKREAATPAPANSVQLLLMGSASEGPLVVNNSFLDLMTLKAMPIKVPGDKWGRFLGRGQFRASSDGQAFTAWADRGQTGNFFFLEDNELKCRPNEQSNSAGQLLPGFRGQVLCTASGLRANNFQPISSGDWAGQPIPATQGNFFAVVRSLQPKGMSIRLAGDPDLEFVLPQVEHGLSSVWTDQGEFVGDKRLFFIPSAKVVITFAPSDQVVLYRFDLDEALETLGKDYLLVTSLPAERARKGSLYTYQVVARSKRGGLKYKLDAAPEGMEISPSGRIRWQVPAATKEPQYPVIVTVTDATGQEVFHAFQVTCAP
jgi:hypothetical protein